MINKKPKINSVDKEKVTIEVEDTDVPVTNTDVATVITNEPITENLNEEQPENSNTQMIEKQQNMEASSSQTAEEKDIDIREKYKQIKTKNEEIKNEIYSQYLKQTPDVQNKLLSAFNYSNKNLIMSVLQPIVKTPKTVADYKKVDLEVPT